MLRVIVVLGVIAGLAMPAEPAVVICRKGQKKALRLRPDECRGRETQVDPTELGVVGPPGQMGPPGPAGPVGSAGADGLPGLPGDVVGEDLVAVGTSDPILPNQGFMNLNQRCIDAFGASARMCTTADAANTGNVGFGGAAWVHPVLQLGERTTADGIDDVIVLDVVSGTSNFDVIGPTLHPGRLTCQGWTGTGSFFLGLTLSGSGRFALDACDQVLPVLCCAPAS